MNKKLQKRLNSILKDWKLFDCLEFRKEIRLLLKITKQVK